MKPPQLWLVFRLLLLSLAGASVAAASSGADGSGWNEFRGPGGSGVAQDAKPPVKPDAGSLAWATAVPPGLSSPVVAGGWVYLTGVDGERLVTMGLDALTGKVRWRQDGGLANEVVHEVNSRATPTPLLADGRVYVHFGSVGLICYDRDGVEQWRKSIPTPKSLYGVATSPVAHGDNLILVLDDDANLPGSKVSRSRIICVKRSTGELVWETARPLLRSGWSTPTLWRHEQGEELVVLGSGRLCGYDPGTGAEKWFVTGFARETIGRPVVEGGMVYAASAMGGRADERPDPEPLWKAMLHFDADGDGRIARGEMTHHFTFPFRPEVPVDHPGFGLPLPSDPVRRKERQAEVFGWIDKDRDGFWTRDEFAANLTPRWEKPRLVAVRPGGRGDVTGTHVAWELNRSIPEIPSPLSHAGRIYLVRNGGLLTAVDAATGKVMADERVGGPGQYTASPVMADGHLYLVSNRGVVTVVRIEAGDRFQVVHQHDLGETAMVTPALAGSALYVRTAARLSTFRAGSR